MNIIQENTLVLESNQVSKENSGLKDKLVSKESPGLKDKLASKESPGLKDKLASKENPLLMDNSVPEENPILKNKLVLAEKSIFLVFVDGHFDMHQSDVEQLPTQVLFSPFNAVVPWLNGIFLYLPKNCHISAPIYLIFKNDKDKSCYLRNTIIMEENSKAIIVEEYKSHSISSSNEKKTNIATEIQLEKNASLAYYKLQDESLTTIHHANIVIQQKESSTSTLFFADCGAQHAHVNLQVNLDEKYATCHLSGLYQLNQDAQQINNHMHINHVAEYGTSSMHFKGILDNRSQAEFIGKVYVHPKAQHTQAQQSNHHLLLSSHAEVKTKPELEIYADDVKCAHGATVGQLDEESLFYLCSRGITKQDALQMLIAAFADDIMNKMEHITIRHYIQERMSQYA